MATKEAQIIQLASTYDMKVSALLHMVRTVQHYNAEIVQLEQYIAHLDSTGKDTVLKSAQLAVMKASRDLLKKSKNCIEFRLWSKNPVQLNDLVRGAWYRGAFEVVKLVSCETHSGNFADYDNGMPQSFYTIHVRPVQ